MRSKPGRMTLKKMDGTTVCARCELAERPLKRMRGLLGRSSLGQDEGMLFRPASSIHMLFMRFPIDAVFCDRDLRVVGVESGLQPWRMAGRRGAKAVIELAAGSAAGIRPGDQLTLETSGITRSRDMRTERARKPREAHSRSSRNESHD